MTSWWRSAGATRSCSIFKPPRIAESLARRAALTAHPDLDAYRLINGVADGAPGVSVDRYADVAVVHADTPSVVDPWLPAIREVTTPLCSTAYVKVHPPTATRLRHEERRVLAPAEPAWGPPRPEVIVIENGVRYLVRLEAGLSVGLFLDMREVRQWLRSQCAGRTVLNLFAYTCSLGVCAALGRARRVVNVDVSRPYLAWGKANYAVNALPVDERDFIYGDAFDWLKRFARRTETFDVVIVDPPSFSSTPLAVTRDYPRLTAAASRVVSRNGLLLTATNHAQTGDVRFDAWLDEGLSLAARRGREVGRWHEPSVDFPVAHGARPHLKVRTLELD
jgi:23S rRNA (cytosine1962-C5)-methyltransferase